jgi:hypothetical protein
MAHSEIAAPCLDWQLCCKTEPVQRLHSALSRASQQFTFGWLITRKYLWQLKRIPMAGRSGVVAAALAAADLGLSTLYPVFASYRAITTGDRSEQKRWLLVWLALTAVRAADGAAGKLVSAIPMRAELRVLLFLWIMLPQTRVRRRKRRALRANERPSILPS